MDIKLKMMNLRCKFHNIRAHFHFRHTMIKEAVQNPYTPNQLSENVIQFTQPRVVLHGVIMERNDLGGINYSLDPSKITPLAYNFVFQQQKTPNPNPKNLTNELERVFYNDTELEDLFIRQPNLNRTVGSLPQKWGRRIGNSHEKRERIDNLFAEFGRKFYATVEDKYSKTEIETNTLQEGLSEVLSEKVTITKLNHGGIGQTYRINAGSQDYVLKVYYKKPDPGYSVNTHLNGNYGELISAVWASKHDADRYVMFYMGRFGENRDGYILTRYLPNRSNYRIYNGKPAHDEDNFVFSNYLHRLNCTDLNYQGNTLNKKICDFGDCNISEIAQMGEKTFKLAHSLGRFLDENNSKDLAKEIAKHQGTKELEQAKAYLQYLINKYTTVKNCHILRNKKDLLAQLGLDYVPDIRYALANMNFTATPGIGTEAEICKYSNILGIPGNAFRPLWEKYKSVRLNVPDINS